MVVSAGKPPVILVVEDEALVRLVVVEYLASAGYSVLEAGHAAAAIDTLTDHSIDVVFSDVQMPGSMDGYGLAEWIETNLPDVAVLLTSGRSFDRGHGAAELLRKPYDFDDLQNHVDLALLSTRRRDSGTAAVIRS